MEKLFLQTVNISIVSSYLVMAVLILRLLLKKAPRWVSCVLWGLVAIRLVFPFSIESALSLIPSARPIPDNFTYTAHPYVESGVTFIDRAVNPVVEQSLGTHDIATSVNNTQIFSFAFSIIWIAGVVLMFTYAVVSTFLLKRKLRTATLFKSGIRQSDMIESPFVLGIIKPVIYLPYNIRESDLRYVIEHEKAHISRHDNIWKPLGFCILSVYWFNPVLWLAYVLLCRDIEAACDEYVIRDMGADERRSYSSALLECSISRRMITACPVAFGENNIKTRIRDVMNYKKPAFWIVIAALAACIIVGLCFLTNPRNNDHVITVTVPAGSYLYLSDEEFSVRRNRGQVTMMLNEGQPEVKAFLLATECKTNTDYDSVMMEPGVPVTIEIEKGAWFKIGVVLSAPSESDETYYFTVKKTDVRISSVETVYGVTTEDNKDSVPEQIETDRESDESGYPDNTEEADPVNSAPNDSTDANDDAGYKGSEDVANDEYSDGRDDFSALKWDDFGFDCWPLGDGSALRDEWTEETPFWQFTAPKGTEVYAVKDGIAAGGYNTNDGNYVEIALGDVNSTVIRYCHLDKQYIEVPHFISAGETIGTVGATGMATGPFLKVSISYNPNKRAVREPELMECAFRVGGFVGKITADITCDAFTEPDTCSLFVQDDSGRVIWDADLGTPHMGWNSYYIYRASYEDYLIQYYPSISQGMVTYDFKMFSLEPDKEKGAINIICEYHAYSSDEIDEFMKNTEPYMSNAMLIASTINGVITTEVPKGSRSMIEPHNDTHTVTPGHHNDIHDNHH